MPRTYKPKPRKPVEVPAEYRPGFLAKLDQRTEVARLLRERFAALASDMGGIDNMSGIQASLLERFTFLEANLSRLESELTTTTDPKGASEVMSRWVQACNALLGIGRTLGLKRQLKANDLQSYIATATVRDPKEEEEDE